MKAHQVPVATSETRVEPIDRVGRSGRYWTAKLAAIGDPLGLDFDGSTHGRAPQWSSVVGPPDAQLGLALRRVAAGSPFLMYTALVAAWKAFLLCLTGRKRITTGSPVRRLENGSLQPANALPIVNDVDWHVTFRALLSAVRETLLEAYDHQDWPLADAAGGDGEESWNHAPWFDLGIGLDEIHGQWPTLPIGVAVNYRLDDGNLAVAVRFDQLRFSEALIRSAVDAVAVLLGAALDRPDTPLWQLPTAPTAATNDDGRRAVLPEAVVQCMHERVETQARATPDRVAVVCGNRSLTYAELDQRAVALAHRLQALGVGPERRVGICLPRSLELPIAVFAVLKAGGAYVGLDPGEPKERLLYVLDDSGTRVVLASDSLRGALQDQVVVIDPSGETSGDVDGFLITSQATPDNLAYVIYTSGSTGRPKGVGGTHRQLASYVDAIQFRLGGFGGKRFAMLHNLAVDAPITYLYGALCHGGELHVLTDDVVGDPERLGTYVDERQVDHLKLAPSYLQVLLKSSPHTVALPTEAVLVGGEPSSYRLVKEVEDARPACRFINHYGPTETTCGVSTYDARVDGDGRHPAGGDRVVPLGTALDNSTLYVVDARGEIAPDELPGEICIGGGGVSRGYLFRPRLTAERFVPDPFASKPGARMHRTGDWGRHTRGGVVEFLGRRDGQVKIRGFRVDVGEVEAALSAHPGVSECAVGAKPDVDGSLVLVGYVVPNAGVAPVALSSELRHRVEAQLPRHMVPTSFVFLERLPRTPQGKLHRAALPEPTFDQQEREQNWTPVEEIAAGIWESVLGRPVASRQADFFELGGHSLLAARITARLRTALGAEIPLRSLFEAPTLARFAERISEHVSAGGSSLPPLAAVPRGSRLPLSFAQRRLWFLARLNPRSSAYHVPYATYLDGELDRRALRRAIDWLVARHEILRTTFPAADGDPIQEISPHGRIRVVEVDLEHLAGRDAALRALSDREGLRPFDLGRGPLLRVVLVRLAARRHVLMVTLHHIVSDAWSLGVMMRDFGVFYAAAAEDAGVSLPDLPVQYADYAAWQQETLSGAQLESALSYWRQQLEGLVRLDLPRDHSPAADTAPRAALFHLNVDVDVSERLRVLSRDQGVTLFMTLLAAFQAVLARHAGRDDVSVGTVVANRTPESIESLIGCFVNTLVLRARIGARMPFSELLVRTRAAVLDAHSHQHVPFEKLVEELAPERDRTRTPLFQVMFSFQNAPQTLLRMAGLVCTPFVRASGATKFDLTLSVANVNGALRCGFEYRPDVFARSTIEGLAAHYAALLEAVTEDPTRPLAECLRTSASERLTVMGWGRGDVVAQNRPCVHELFEAHARQQPVAPALVSGDLVLDYATLNGRANRLARLLREWGVGREVRVAVCLERGPDLVVALLGVLKAGGVYVPLDPATPDERLAFMMADAGASVMLTHSALPVAHVTGAVTVWMDRDFDHIASFENHDLGRGPGPDDLAYIMYTSGSTGRPKGVMVTHRAISRLTASAFALGDRDARYLQYAPASFDASTFEIWCALAGGGTLVVAPPGQLSLQELDQLLKRQRVTVAWLTAGLFTQMVEEHVDALAGLDRVLAGGDVLPVPQVHAALQAGAKVINGYGPTETTTFACTYAVGPNDPLGPRVPIGRPIAATSVYVLDEDGEALAIGLAGELHIAGDGVARGYVNRPRLTAERFIPDPFGAPGTRMFRTGDRVRWRADAQLDFLGRLDNQVKIRGFRVEPAEVENTIREHASVADAVVVARPAATGDRQLVAYVCPDAAIPLDVDDLRILLAQRLPPYLLPSAIVVMARLPLTQNGKVDRAALPEPEIDASVRAPEPAVTPLEEILANIWATVLNRPDCGRHDNFFDLGGHSLLATQMVARIRRTIGVDVPLEAIFDEPTVAGLARRIDADRRQGRSPEPPLVSVSREVEPPLSFAQQRLWFLDQLTPNSSDYNVPIAIALEGDLDRKALRAAIDGLVSRHETLRTAFPMRGDRPVQEIAPRGACELAHVDLRGVANGERIARALAAGEASRPFDLRRGPLCRIALVQTGATRYLLLVTLHHIISDGWSMGILARDCGELYAASRRRQPVRLPALPVQYADYASWQRELLTGERLQTDLDYWRRRLADLETLSFAATRPRTAPRSPAGARLTIVVTSTTAARVQELARDRSVTLFMLLASVFEVAVAVLFGADDFGVGTDMAHRTQPQTEGLIGLFLNQLVLRARLAGVSTFHSLLTATRAATLEAFAHQELPFERLVQELSPTRTALPPLFQVKFVFDNYPRSNFDLPGLSASVLETVRSVPRFPLTLTMGLSGECIEGSIVYDRRLISDASAESFKDVFLRCADAVVRDPELDLDGLRRQLAEVVHARRGDLVASARQRSAERWGRLGHQSSAAHSAES